MKKSKYLLVSGIIASIYVVFAFSGLIYLVNTDGTASEEVAAGLLFVFLIPHILTMILGLIFNWVAFGLNKRWSALVAGIMYSVSAVLSLFSIYTFLIIVLSIVFTFIGFAKIEH